MAEHHREMMHRPVLSFTRCQLPTTQLSKINSSSGCRSSWVNRRQTALSEQRPNLRVAKPVRNHHPWLRQSRPITTDCLSELLALNPDPKWETTKSIKRSGPCKGVFAEIIGKPKTFRRLNLGRGWAKPLEIGPSRFAAEVLAFLRLILIISAANWPTRRQNGRGQTAGCRRVLRLIFYFVHMLSRDEFCALFSGEGILDRKSTRLNSSHTS